MEFTKEITGAYTLLQEKLISWFEQGVLILPNLAIAFVVFLLFFILANIVKSVISSALERAQLRNKALITFISIFARLAVLSLGFLFAINILHLDKAVTSILAGLGIIGFALGFAFQDVAANLVSGIAMVLKEGFPFKVGDLIETNGIQAGVVEIQLRSTTLRTFQGHTIIVPNKQIFENPIINYSMIGKYRIDLPIGVSYGDDLEKVEKVTKEAIVNLPELAEPKDIDLVYTGFGDSSIDLLLVFWVRMDKGNEHITATHGAVKAVKAAYAANDICIPFPIRTLDFGIKGGINLQKEIATLAAKN